MKYRDGDQLRAELFDAEARAEAERLKRIKPSQIRRFYAAVTGFVRQMDLDPKLTDEDARVSMALLKASATYAANRTDAHTPIQSFFDVHTTAVKTKRDYRDFAKHFEAVIAYHKTSEDKAGDRDRSFAQ